MTVYLSGPISGIKDGNWAAFEKAERIMIGIVGTGNVVNPHKLHHLAGAQWIDYMKTDIKALLKCDAIYMLPGWEDSKGALIEHGIAHGLGYVIYQAGGKSVQ